LYSSSTQVPSKSNKMTRTSYLKGSRKLQTFSGGIISGSSFGGGTALGSGSAMTGTVAGVVGVADATGSGEFTSTSGSSGFIDTVFGYAEGSSAAGGSGTQAGNVGITGGGLGTLTFAGTTSASGNGGFGGGLSPVQFNTVVTEVPGTPIPPTSSGGSKKGGSTGGGVTPPTFITTVVPMSTGPTGGFGFGNGLLSIGSTTGGTLMGNLTQIGIGSSGGTANNFGGGMASATNYFGTAGGLGSGAGSGVVAAAGNTKFDMLNGIFLATGGTDGSFTNQGSGLFGLAPP
jgi:hypothetical protein